ncbi:hypothetical protein SAMN05444157_0711 [Frankineae bacterium MT45]|nr:hypothetical protein SAMN05444157_0711 [Frankineae bacterium MT45]
MSKTYKDAPDGKARRTRRGAGQQRNISVRAVRRDPVDLRKLSRALIQLALAEAEAETDTSTNTEPRDINAQTEGEDV